jgi:hypothetical protein
MIETTHFDTHAYVAAVAPAVGLQLNAPRQAAVAEALALVARIAAPALALTPSAEIEPAPVFAP